MSFKVPERFRVWDPKDRRARSAAGNLATKADALNNGLFHLPPKIPGRELRCLASDGGGWEHVSVSIWRAPEKIPTWVEMDYTARLFWDAEDAIVQFHPPRSAHVNFHHGCLHLWRPVEQALPLPPAIFVGPPAWAVQRLHALLPLLRDLNGEGSSFGSDP